MSEEKPLNEFKRCKITVATSSAVYPPITGSQLRIYHLYKNLAKWYDIELITYTDYGNKLKKVKICPGFWEISVPKSYLHYKTEMDLYTKMGPLAYEYSLLNLHQLSPEYLVELEKSSVNSEVVISSHPYSFPAIKEVTAKKVWYDAHNVEYELQKSLLEKNSYNKEFLEQIKNIEEECCKTSELIMTCSLEDKNSISQIYNINTSNIIVVPNGTDTDKTKCILPSERYELKRKYNINGSPVAFFIGAYYKPNIIAAEHIIKLAHNLPYVSFIVTGYVCNHFKNIHLPSNVKLTGEISSRKKALLFSYADIALNPMIYGSGTNIKMLEYFAYGIPVISTPLGVRGLNVENEKQCIICEIDQFEKAIKKLKNCSLSSKNSLAVNARKYVESEFNWKVIAERTFKYIHSKNII